LVQRGRGTGFPRQPVSGARDRIPAPAGVDAPAGKWGAGQGSKSYRHSRGRIAASAVALGPPPAQIRSKNTGSVGRRPRNIPGPRTRCRYTKRAAGLAGFPRSLPPGVGIAELNMLGYHPVRVQKTPVKKSPRNKRNLRRTQTRSRRSLAVRKQPADFL